MGRRIAVVTGALGGLGMAIVRRLSTSMCVVALDAADGSLDVTDRQSVRRCAQAVLDQHGRVDVLVNAAGVFHRTPVLDMDDDVMERIVDVNLLGTLRCMSEFGKPMAARGRGRIINIASIAGVIGASTAAAYAASKAGVLAATRTAARELGPHGVMVVALAPGFCDTPMLAPDRAYVDRFVLPRIPLKRVAQADEVAEVVRFAATCRTDYLTGGVLTLDGGLHAG